MLEQLVQVSGTDQDSSSKAIYSRFKSSVDGNERAKDMARITPKNAFRYMLAPLAISRYTSELQTRKVDAVLVAEHDISQNFDLRIQEAIHDATAAGVELNLPSSDVVEAANRVQAVVEQVQPKRN